MSCGYLWKFWGKWNWWELEFSLQSPYLEHNETSIRSSHLIVSTTSWPSSTLAPAILAISTAAASSSKPLAISGESGGAHLPATVTTRLARWPKEWVYSVTELGVKDLASPLQLLLALGLGVRVLHLDVKVNSEGRSPSARPALPPHCPRLPDLHLARGARVLPHAEGRANQPANLDLLGALDIDLHVQGGLQVVRSLLPAETPFERLPEHVVLKGLTQHDGPSRLFHHRVHLRRPRLIQGAREEVAAVAANHEPATQLREVQRRLRETLYCAPGILLKVVMGPVVARQVCVHDLPRPWVHAPPAKRQTLQPPLGMQTSARATATAMAAPVHRSGR